MSADSAYLKAAVAEVRTRRCRSRGRSRFCIERERKREKESIVRAAPCFPLHQLMVLCASPLRVPRAACSLSVPCVPCVLCHQPLAQALAAAVVAQPADMVCSLTLSLSLLPPSLSL